MPSANTTPFILLAVKHEAAYWTPETIAREVHERGLLEPQSEEELTEFRDEVLRDLVGKAAERFWASDAVTPAKAAAIRAACRALHDVTLEGFAAATAQG